MAKSIKVRVNDKTWKKARQTLGHPDVTDQEISKILYNTSLVRIQKKTDDIKLGEKIYGKNMWKRIRKKG